MATSIHTKMEMSDLVILMEYQNKQIERVLAISESQQSHIERLTKINNFLVEIINNHPSSLNLQQYEINFLHSILKDKI